MVGHVFVSVVMPAYNQARYIREAVDSVLSQDFPFFELIVINDGSTDETGQILDSYSDPRLRVIHQKNQGLAATLNFALQECRSIYMARQDHDDILLPGRLAQQYAFMEANPDCGLVGTWSRIVVGSEPSERGHRHPVSNGALQVWGLFDSFFVHSSVMIRRSVALAAGNYPLDPARNPPEDFDLWSRISRISRVANLPEILTIYREVPNSISRERHELIQARVRIIAIENLKYLLGNNINEALLSDMVSVGRMTFGNMSELPNWKALSKLVDDIEENIGARFPEDKAEISRACNELRERCNRVGVKNGPRVESTGVSLLRRVVRRLKRLYNEWKTSRNTA